MMSFLFKNRRKISLFLLFSLLAPFGIQPAVALTSGPNAPEFSLASPLGTSNMVDPFTGDFSYSIPLFNLPGPNGGYPFTLNYSAGIGMDDEASWVGLGWNLTSGSINRQMRGYPDEFLGDTIHNTVSMVPNVTVGMEAGLGFELFGYNKGRTDSAAINLGIGLGVYNNTLTGPGYTLAADAGLSRITRSPLIGGDFGLNFDTNQGGTVGAGISYGHESNQFGLRGDYHSKSGLNSISFYSNYRLINSLTYVAFGFSPYLAFNHPSYFPQNPFPMVNSNYSAIVKAGPSGYGLFPNGYFRGY